MGVQLPTPAGSSGGLTVVPGLRLQHCSSRCFWDIGVQGTYYGGGACKGTAQGRPKAFISTGSPHRSHQPSARRQFLQLSVGVWTRERMHAVHGGNAQYTAAAAAAAMSECEWCMTWM
eukprot:2064028-Amphidinium_carterae.1